MRDRALLQAPAHFVRHVPGQEFFKVGWCLGRFLASHHRFQIWAGAAVFVQPTFFVDVVLAQDGKDDVELFLDVFQAELFIFGQAFLFEGTGPFGRHL